MYQSWRDLTFLHWRYPVDVIQRLVPGPLRVDSFDGTAWVGVIPFMVGGLRPPFLPQFPRISNFPETNCRTYVTAPDGSAGVWFFSLDAGSAFAVAGARLTYGLPYFWSKMQVRRSARRFSYASSRFSPHAPALSSIEVVESGPIETTALETFLTARFRLYSRLFGQLTYAAVEHPPWPLRSAEVVRINQTLTNAAGLPAPAGAPIAHFSPGVTVRVARPKRLR
jgi:uncharacterized protein YqjF (DUF2071 family)